jgi:hypothetical protein
MLEPHQSLAKSFQLCRADSREHKMSSLVGLNLNNSGLVGHGKCEIPTSSVRKKGLHIVLGLDRAEDG